MSKQQVTSRKTSGAQGHQKVKEGWLLPEMCLLRFRKHWQFSVECGLAARMKYRGTEQRKWKKENDTDESVKSLARKGRRKIICLGKVIGVLSF